MVTVNFAFLDPLHPAVEKLVRERLPEGWRVEFAASRKQKDQESAIESADVAFLIGVPVPAQLVAHAKKLKIIQKLGVGVDKIDVAACAERNIAVARTFGANAVPVAEHAMLLILATLRRLPLIDRRTRAGDWLKEESRAIHRQIHGRQVGIVGFGAIGRALARLLTGFGCKVVYYDPMQASPEVERELSATCVDLDTLIAGSDIISLHLPLTEQTRGIISADRISRMKPGTVIVNCARGGLIDEQALLGALEAGHLLGAGLDVFEQEPPAGSPLLQSDATVVTPHLAGATLDNFINVMDRSVQNVTDYLATGRIRECDVVFSPGETVANF